MPVNAELSNIFTQMADVLELQGANRFKVNAHRRVARLLKDLPTDISSMADDLKSLTALDGIGDGTAKKIMEFVDSGSIEEHQELLADIPSGLLDLLQISGLGPKTVKLMWEESGVTDQDSLKAALEEGTLETLKGMGEKSVQKIRESLEFAESSAGRIRLGEALPLAERIVEILRNVKGAKRIEYAGSLRRARETIGDIDILATATDEDALRDAFVNLDGVSQVLAKGSTKCSVRLSIGVQVDLRIVESSGFGAALMYFTGSKDHNVALRERAIKQKMRLNEYGLFEDDGNDAPPQKRGLKPVVAKTEQQIYKALKLAYVPPELREDRGELTTDSPQNLIAVEDILSDLHTHTIASDGKMKIEEVANLARARGYHTVAITDHSKSSAQANGLDEKRLLEHIKAVRTVSDEVEGITCLAGSEVDILSDGHLDYDDDILEQLDLVVASPHVALRQSTKDATARILKAIEHPLVNIIGHPTGRIINGRPGLELDFDTLIPAAVEHNTALEINANYFRLDLRDTHVRAVAEAGGLIAINTDAHTPENFDQLRYGVMTARRGWLPKDQCINTWPLKKLLGWLGRS